MAVSARRGTSAGVAVGALALVLVALALALPPTAAAAPLEGYDGSNPFVCTLQQVGKGTDFPDPRADPFCVEYDKTEQNVTELGVVEFLSKEPARVAVALDKCFYYQRDHWRGSIVQEDGRTVTYTFDGSYFFDRARGVGGAYVENFKLAGQTGDPTSLPGFPAEYRPFFGNGRGGIRSGQGIVMEPRCVERAGRGGVYAQPGGSGGGGPGPPGSRPPATPRLGLRLAYRAGRSPGGARCMRSGLTATVDGPDRRRVRSVDFLVGGRVVARDGSAPFRRGIAERHFRAGRSYRIEARTRLSDGRRTTYARMVRACARSAGRPRFTG